MKPARRVQMTQEVTRRPAHWPIKVHPQPVLVSLDKARLLFLGQRSLDAVPLPAAPRTHMHIHAVIRVHAHAH